MKVHFVETFFYRLCFFLFSLVVLNILSTMLLQLKSETVTNRPNEERCFVALCLSLRFTPSDSHRQTSAGSAAARILNRV